MISKHRAVTTEEAPDNDKWPPTATRNVLFQFTSYNWIRVTHTKEIFRGKKDCGCTFYHNTMRAFRVHKVRRKTYFCNILFLYSVTAVCVLGLKVQESFLCVFGSLPPMCPGFGSRTRRHMWVEFVVGSLLCSGTFFSGSSGFPLCSKTNISKFQFDLGMHGHFWTSSCELLGAPRVNKLHIYRQNYIFFFYERC